MMNPRPRRKFRPGLVKTIGYIILAFGSKRAKLNRKEAGVGWPDAPEQSPIGGWTVMKTVRKLLTEKDNPLWSIAPQARVLDALKLMADKDIGALAVVDNNRLVGIFSERDYARKVILKGKASQNTQVKEVMTTDVITVRPQQTVEECVAIMERNRIRYLPVVDSGKLVGIVSIGDVLQAIISEQADSINKLEVAGLSKDL